MISRYMLIRSNRYLYYILFVMFQLAGVMPIYRYIPPKLSKHRCHPHKDCFSCSAALRVLGIIQIVITGFGFLNAMVHESNPNLSWTTLKVIRWVPPLTALILPICTVSQLLKCTSDACKIFNSLPKKLTYLPLPMFFLMGTLPFFPILNVLRFAFVLPWDLIVQFCFLNYCYISVASTESLFCALCFITGRAIDSINLKLDYCKGKKPSLKQLNVLKTLLNKHVIVGIFIKNVASYFSPHFLNSILSFTFRNIIYAAIFSWLKNNGRFGDIEAIVLNAVYLLVRLIFVCYMCHKVKEKAHKTRVIINHLQLCWFENLTKKEAEQIDIYKELLEATNVDFHACGLFPVSMVELISILSLICTYGIAALQAK